jgi:hypothetical protein
MNRNKTEKFAILAHVPGDVRDFIANEAALNCSSQNSEIVRSVRQRMEREREARAAKDRALTADSESSPQSQPAPAP